MVLKYFKINIFSWCSVILLADLLNVLFLYGVKIHFNPALALAMYWAKDFVLENIKVNTTADTEELDNACPPS